MLYLLKCQRKELILSATNKSTIYCNEGSGLSFNTVQATILKNALPDISFNKENIEKSLPLSFDCLDEGVNIVEVIRRN